MSMLLRFARPLVRPSLLGPAAAVVPTALAALVLWPAALTAQSDQLAPGDEVRIRWDVGYHHSYPFGYMQSMTATVMDYDGIRIMVREGRKVVTIPLSSVRSLERRIGTRPSSAPAMVMGSGIGFAAGFAIGAIGATARPTGEDRSVVNAGISTGVLLGAPLGAFVAYLTSRERGIYESVRRRNLDPSVAVSASGAIGVGMSIGIR